MADNRDLHEQALTEFGRLLDNVKDDQWGRTTPCTEWDVKALVTHVTGGNHMFAAISRGEKPDPSKMVPAADPKAAFAESTKVVGEAFAVDGVNDRMFEMPFGTLPAQAAIGIHVTDVVVHGWDLAKASGQSPDFPQDLVDTALGIAQMFPDVPEIRGLGKPFGPKVAVGDDAPAIDRLVANLGRQP